MVKEVTLLVTSTARPKLAFKKKKEKVYFTLIKHLKLKNAYTKQTETVKPVEICAVLCFLCMHQ